MKRMFVALLLTSTMIGSAAAETGDDEATSRANTAPVTTAPISAAPGNTSPSPLSLSGAAAAASTGHAFGAVVDWWLHDSVSTISQLEYVDTPGDGFHSLRFDMGVGAEFDRPHLRTGVHAGGGFELAPMNAVEEEDHAGVAGFVEARAEATPGTLYLFGTARATYYHDLDCNDKVERTKYGTQKSSDCTTHSDDFTPHVGWEMEVRVGSTRAGGGVVKGRSQGGYLGARFTSVSTDERTEHHVMAMVGWATW